jgi:hypothetical protein
MQVGVITLASSIVTCLAFTFVVVITLVFFNCYLPLLSHTPHGSIPFSSALPGGRTGLAACVTAALFLAASVFAPLFAAVPVEAVAPLIVLIGAMMMGEARNIDWDRLDQVGDVLM